MQTQLNVVYSHTVVTDIPLVWTDNVQRSTAHSSWDGEASLSSFVLVLGDGVCANSDNCMTSPTNLM